LHRRRLERDLEDELQFHLASRASRYVSAGATPEIAAHHALHDLGSPTHWKETCRDMWTFYWFEMLLQDLRYGIRSLVKSPRFTPVAGLPLAPALAPTPAIFSVVNAAILRPLPYPEPSRLVELWGNVTRAKVERRGASLPDYADWRDQSRSFESMA